MWYGCGMVLHLVRVLALLVAACLAPSLAYAHAGHTDHAHHASAPADIASPATPGHKDQIAATVIVKAAVASAASSGDRTSSGCAGHCCGTAAGMPCCGAALVPEISTAPDVLNSHRVRFARAAALLGLPPDALPKPPKSLG